MTMPVVLISEEEIQSRVLELAEQISADYDENDELVMIGVLKGSFFFRADLSRRRSIPRTFELIAVSRAAAHQAPYGSSWTCAAILRVSMS